MTHAIILDTETTGLEEPQPVEVAYLMLNGPARMDVASTFHQFYKPAKAISLGALATHHIMDEDLVSAPPYTEFRLPEGTAYLIGHNVDFDWQAIGKPEVKRIDTCCLSRKLWPAADSHSLGALIYLLSRATARTLLMDAHSARQDVNNCLLLLDTILKKVGDPETWEAVWQLSEEARIPDVMPFGKHKGTRITDVPADYKAWLLRQPDVDPYLVTALRRSKVAA